MSKEELQQKLDNLTFLSVGAHQLADTACRQIKDGYKAIITDMLVKNNFPGDKITHIEYDIVANVSEKARYWSRDLLRIYVADPEDKTYYGHSFDVDIKPTSVKINNCCTGQWELGDWYYYYIKLTILIAEISEQLKTYCQEVERIDLQEEERINSELDSVKQQIENINYNEERDKHIKELDSAEFIGCYEKLNRWDTGYIEGQDTYKLKSLFKVIHRTPKKYIVEEYEKDYEGDHQIDVWTKKWYSAEKKIKKEAIYSTYRYKTIYYPYNVVNRNEIEIRD